ncbi:MAG TPA: hypothetical protein VGD40_13390 [Chryseosolibacter sp.]
MSSQLISEIIRYASIFSVAFPLILYLFRIKHLSRSGHKIGAIVIVSAVCDLIAHFLFEAKMSTVLVFNAYFLIFFVLLAWFYSDVLQTTRGKRTVQWGLGIYLLTYIVIAIFFQAFNEYQTLMWTLSGAICIIYSISYFISVFSAVRPMNDFGLLWINSGILFYFSFNLFLFIMSSYVLTKLEPELSLIVWSFHNVNNIIKNILIGLGISTVRADEIGAKDAV